MRYFTPFLALVLALAGCGQQAPTEPAAGTPAAGAEAPAEAAAPAPMEAGIPMRNFAALTIGPYAVQPMYEEEIEDGHYNIRIEGGEVEAVRIWVGPEDASGVMVVKTAIENDYHHGHVELPAPLPGDARLWIEVENPDGELFKGSTPLEPAQ